MFADDTISSSAASSPMRHGPKPSPISELRSTVRVMSGPFKIVAGGRPADQLVAEQIGNVMGIADHRLAHFGEGALRGRLRRCGSVCFWDSQERELKRRAGCGLCDFWQVC